MSKLFEEMAQGTAEAFKAYDTILQNGFTPDYMEVALKHIREWSQAWSKAPNCREDILKFVEDTEQLPGSAVVAFSKDRITLLTNADGGLLEFA